MSYMLIDGNSIGYAAQMSPTLTCDGEPVQAIFYTLNIIRRVVRAYPGYREYRPIVLWDGRPKARLELYPEYKAKREDTDEKVDIRAEYHKQVPAIRKLLKAQGGGAMVNLSSTAGLFGYPNRSPYCASKWAIIGLTKTLALELGPHGVRVNAICPGVVEGDRMNRVIAAEAAATGRTPDEIRAGYVRTSALRCFIRPEDIAATILFLCSPAGARISGQAIPVDGHTESNTV